eukprot:2647236-Amphidinium_carterae.1
MILFCFSRESKTGHAEGPYLVSQVRKDDKNTTTNYTNVMEQRKTEASVEQRTRNFAGTKH